MANIKSQKKRILTDEKARVRNVAVRTRLKTYMKKADTAIESKDAGAAKDAIKVAISEIDLAVKKGTIHANSAARKKSSLERRVAAL